MVVCLPLNSGISSRLLVVQRAKDGLQRVMCAADVHDDPVRRDVLAKERDVDDEGSAVQRLGRPEELALETVRDHDVVAHFDGKHAWLLVLVR